MPKDQKGSILGIDNDILEKFLILVRDRYHEVDQANYFLESNTNISGSNIAMANQRDFLSHLCTILRKPELTKQEQLDQISTAEEHSRRAIIESYQLSVSVKQKNIIKLIEEYKTKVVPIKNEESVLNSGLSISSIRH